MSYLAPLHTLKRKLITPSILFVLFSMQAQGSGDIPPINSLRTPTTPAAVLLGVEQTAVERPTTPSALAATILSNTQDLSSFPKNYALEITPYWMTYHPALAWTADTIRSISQSVIRTFRISTATAQTGSEDALSTGLSAGFTTSFLSGKMSPQSIEKITKSDNDLATLMLSIDTSMTDEQIDSIMQTRANDLAKDLDIKRVGWHWDIAGGLKWYFPDNTAAKGKYAGGGGWSTISYDTESGESFVFVARWLDDKTISPDWVAEIGVRAVHETKLVSVSFERVDRIFGGDTDQKTQQRYTALFEYSLADGKKLSFTLGQDYNKEAANSFLAQIGISLGFNPTP